MKSSFWVFEDIEFLPKRTKKEPAYTCDFQLADHVAGAHAQLGPRGRHGQRRVARLPRTPPVPLPLRDHHHTQVTTFAFEIGRLFSHQLNDSGIIQDPPTLTSRIAETLCSDFNS